MRLSSGFSPWTEAGRASLKGLMLASPREAAPVPADVYRALRARIELATAQWSLRNLVVVRFTDRVPAMPILTGLGLAFAQVEVDVLLVDADSHAPSLHDAHDLPLAPGLYQWLDDEGSPLPLQSAAGGALKALTAGARGTDPLQALSLDRLATLLARLQEAVQLAIWTAPPLLASPAGALVACHADAVLLAVRMGQERRREVVRVRHALAQAGARIIGAVACTASRADAA